MKPLGDVRRHFFLVKRMARVTGADIDSARLNGWLDDEEWAATVTRCRGCACAEACECWLSEGEKAGAGRRSVPTACENRDLLRSLSHLAEG